MTNEEVSDWLYRIRSRAEVFMSEAQNAKAKEAVATAIKALNRKPCEDCISRQEAIETANKVIERDTSGNNDVVNAMIAWSVYIKSLPSVTPQPTRWIPVSERLPEDGRPVLIYAWNVHHVIARYGSFRTENGYKNTWVTADAWNGNTEIRHEVIAWMPLPEPYKEEQE